MLNLCTRSAKATSSPGSAQPQVAASRPMTASGRPPARRNDAMRVSPWRLASRRPSEPTTSGTWQYTGVGRPRARYTRICAGVAGSRSSPRTTSVTPIVASSTTTASV